MSEQASTRDQHIGRLHVDLLTPLREAIEGPLAQMRITLRAIENESYEEQRNSPTPGGSVPLVLTTAPDLSAIQQRALREAFLAIIRAFVDFIDTLAGLKEVVSGNFQVTRDLTSADEFLAFFQEIRDEHTRKIAQDRRLSAYEKVRIIAALPDEQDRMVTGYFKTRRALEHHKAIPTEDIYLGAYAVRIEVDGTDIVESLPYHAEAGQQLRVGLFEQGRTIAAGQEIALSELEVSYIANSILLWIAPTLIKGLNSDTATRAEQSESSGSDKRRHNPASGNCAQS